jgi:CheY-like chemotaxis protein
MQVVEGWAARLLRHARSDDPFRAGLEMIQEAGRKAASLTRQLLAFGRKQVLNKERLDLGAVVSQMMPMVSRLLSEEIEIDFRPSPPSDPICVEADRSQLEQVVMNLIVNARDAMPRGGKLTVEVGRAGQSPEGVAKPGGRFAELVVTDTGCGMDRQTLEHVFEPFYTTKPLGEGTGLGLSTTYGIVKQSGGEIDVESEPGHGTTFRVMLPLFEAGPDEQRDTMSTEQARAPRLSGTALLVEDEDVVRRLIVMDLEELGMDVIDARGFEGALKIAREYDGRIEVLLTDIALKGRDGTEVARAIREVHPEVKVIYMSGYSDVLVEKRTEGSSTDFIQKPFSADELAEKVKAILGAGPGSDLTGT